MKDLELQKNGDFPWDKLDNESDTKYHAFCIFLDLGSKRSQSQVAKILKLSRGTIIKYAKEFNWLRRAELYDLYSYEKNKSEFLEYVEEHNFKKYEQNIAVSSLFQNLISCLMPYLQTYYNCYHNEEILKKTDFILKIADTIVKLDKMSDFSLNSKLLNDKTLRDFNILNILKFSNTTKEINNGLMGGSNLLIENMMSKSNSFPLNENDNPNFPDHVSKDMYERVTPDFYEMLDKIEREMPKGGYPEDFEPVDDD
jgi:hypothetical protein